MSVTVIDTLRPKNNGTFAIVDSVEALGGFMQVADNTARDAIPASRRRHGMFVFAQDSGNTYQLDANLTSWTLITFGASSNTVIGPASATDNAVARFDTTTGKLIQNSTVTIDDSGNIATSGTVDGRDVSADGALLDARLPTANEKAALAGTGTPSVTNKYVTNDDSRLSDARTPTAHAASHKHGGSDEVATATAAANAIPKAGAGGTLAYAWLPVGTASSTVAAGDDARFPTAAQKAALVGTGTPSSGNPFVNSDDSRLSDSRTPTAHAATHKHGGGDEVATATAAANAIPKAGSGAVLDIGWLPLGTSASTVVVGNDARLPTAGEKAALAGTGTPGSGNKYVTADYSLLLTVDQDAALAGTSGTPNAGNPFVTNTDSRLSDSRTPTAHAASHKHGGSDEVSTATATANAIPKAGAGGTLAYAWMPVGVIASTVAAGDDARFPTANEKAALAGTGTPSSGNKYVTDDDARLPTANQKAALVGTGTPSGSDVYVSSSDSRMSNSRAPNGSASGDLGGSYPSPTVAAIHETSGPTKLTIGAIADGEFTKRVGSTLIGATPAGSGDASGPSSATDNALARFDGTTGKLIQNSTATLDDSGNLALGTGNITTSGTVDGRDVSVDGAASDARLPSTGEKAALAGTSGTPGSGNKYVTDADSRMSNSRAPNGSASGDLGGSYPSPTVLAIHETSGPTKLTIGAIADGQLAYRSGSTLIGGSYLLSEAIGNVTLAVTTGGNDSDPGRPGRIATGDYTAYPFLTIQAALASLPINMGKYIATINIGVGNFAGFTASGIGGPAQGLRLLGTWGNWSVTTGSQSGTAGTGTNSTQLKRPTGSVAWTVDDVAGAFLRVTGGGGYVAGLNESAVPIESNDANWLYLGGGGIQGVDETTTFAIVYPGTRINAVASDTYFGATYGVALLDNTVEVLMKRIKLDVYDAGAAFGILGQRNGAVGLSVCELEKNLHVIAYGPVAVASNMMLKDGAYLNLYGINNVTSYGVQCRNATLDVFSFNTAVCDYIYAKAVTGGNAFRASIGGKLTWGGNFNGCTHTPVYQRTVDKSILGGAGFHGANAGTTRAIDLGDSGTWDLQGANAAGSDPEQIAVDGRYMSWTNLAAFGIVRRFGNILQWGSDAETLLHKLYIPVDPLNPGNEFSTDGTGYFGNKVKLNGPLYAFGLANGDISARIGAGTVTDIKYIATRVTGFVGGSPADHGKVKLPQHFVTDDTVGGAFGFVINDTDYIIDLYPTQSDTNINQLADNVPLQIPPRSWAYWWFLNQYDACAIVMADTLSHVPGTLPITKGGTGQTTALAGFDALAPTGAKGELIAHNGSNSVAFGVGANGQILAADSSTSAGIIWEWPGNGVLSSLVQHSTASGDRNIAIFDGTDGKTIQSAPVYIDAFGRMIIPASVGDELFTQGELTVALTAKFYGGELLLNDAFVIGLTAKAGGGQSGATQLGIRDSIIQNAGADGDSVIFLVRAIRGFKGSVYNVSGYDIDVFPPSGGSLNGLATDAAISLPNNGVMSYISTNTANYQVAVSSVTPGDVVGPSSAVDNRVARFDGTTGKLIQQSVAALDDSGNLSGIGNITLSGTVDGRDVSTDGTKLDTTVVGPGSSVDNTLPRFDSTTGKLIQTSGIVVSDLDEITGYKALVRVQSGSTYTLQASDDGEIIEFSSGCTVTLPNSLVQGFNCTLVAAHATDAVVIAAGSGATLHQRQGYTGTAGQWAPIELYVRSNAGGTSAVYVAFGDMVA